MIFIIDLNRFKHLFREDLRVLQVEHRIQPEEVYALGEKIDIIDIIDIDIDILGGHNDIGLDMDYIVSKIGKRAKLGNIDITTENIESVTHDVIKSQCREHAEDIQQFLLSADITFVTDFLIKFKEEDTENYFEWVSLLTSKDVFRKVVSHMKPTEEKEEI